jgi:hypothetical protein
VPDGNYQTHGFTGVSESTGCFWRNSSQEEALRLGKNVPELPSEINLFGSILPFLDEFRPKDIFQEAPDSTL